MSWYVLASWDIRMVDWYDCDIRMVDCYVLGHQDGGLWYALVCHRTPDGGLVCPGMSWDIRMAD